MKHVDRKSRPVHTGMADIGARRERVDSKGAIDTALVEVTGSFYDPPRDRELKRHYAAGFENGKRVKVTGLTLPPS